MAPSLETEKLLKKLAEMAEILEARETKLGTIHKLRKHNLGFFGPLEGVELELRWQFCVHSSTCPEIYFLSKF